MKTIRRVLKFETEDAIPEGAVYLSTIIQTRDYNYEGDWVDCWYVWHYFILTELVD